MQRYCLTRMESVERVNLDVDVLVSLLPETIFVKKGSSSQQPSASTSINLHNISNRHQLPPANRELN
jgi:hypothetical protein